MKWNWLCTKYQAAAFQTLDSVIQENIDIFLEPVKMLQSAEEKWKISASGRVSASNANYSILTHVI